MYTLLICLTVDSKYLTPSQIVDIVYEGQSSRFAVQSVSTAETGPDDDLIALESNLDQLSLEPKPKLWTVGWDTFVAIVDNSDKSVSKESVSLSFSTI